MTNDERHERFKQVRSAFGTWYYLDGRLVDKETYMKEREKERQDAARELVRGFSSSLSEALRSIPSTNAMSATLTATGSELLSQYNVPIEVISRVSEQQLHKVMEKDLIPIIDMTAERTIKKHAEEERQQEGKPTEKAKRYVYELFWIVVGFLISLVLGLILRNLGIVSFF